MNTIYKYPIEIEDNFVIVMPEGSKPLTVQLQNGSPYLWVLVDPDKQCVPYDFTLMGTGHIHSGDEINHEWYIGTFQMMGGGLVFHLFGNFETEKIKN